MNADTLTRILRFDAAANVLAGAGLVVAGGWLAAPVGSGSSWPIRLAGLALVVYGVENLLVARRTTTAGLTSLIVVDLVFALVVLGIAVADPTSAETWARWAMAGIADVSAVFGIAKFIGLRDVLGVRGRPDIGALRDRGGTP